MALIILGLARIISLVLNVYQMVVIAGVVISWIQLDPRNPVVQFIANVTEPAYEKIRFYTKKLIGDTLGPLDLSPLILLLLIQFIQTAFVGNLFELAKRF